MIPKIIHQIWIQGKENIPEHLQKEYKDCKLINNDFIHKFWGDEEIKHLLRYHFDKEIYDIYNETQIMAQKSDIARYAILYVYGGIYLDMDMKCRKNLDDLLDNYLFFTKDSGISNIYYGKRYLNGIIGVYPKCIVMLDMLNHIKKCYKNDRMKNVTTSTGTNAFYVVVNECIDNKKINTNKVKIISSDKLHPCTLFSDDKCATECKDCYIAHLNSGSWNNSLRILKNSIQYLHNNKGKFCVFIIFVILTIIYFSTNIL